MPSQPNSLYDSVLDSHEERLQKVESDLQEIIATTAEIGANQVHAIEKSTEGHERLAQKLDEGFTDLKALNEKVFARIDEHEKRIEALKDRLAPLEASAKEHKQARAARKGATNKIFMALGAAAAGALGTKIISVLFGAKLASALVSIFFGEP